MLTNFVPKISLLPSLYVKHFHTSYDSCNFLLKLFSATIIPSYHTALAHHTVCKNRKLYSPILRQNTVLNLSLRTGWRDDKQIRLNAERRKHSISVRDHNFFLLYFPCFYFSPPSHPQHTIHFYRKTEI